MSDDWIKMTVGLRTHPKVVRMASALKADRLRVVGGLFAVWSVFDQHSIDGVLDGYTPEAMDEDLGWRGFSRAMESIGWLTVSDSGLEAPDFDIHNSKSAKRRALDSGRKKSARDADEEANGSWNKSGKVSASKADEMRTREELEKEKEPPSPRKRGNEAPPGFDAFWSAFPRKTAKPEAVKAWSRLEPDEDLQADLLKAIDRQRRWPSWTKDGGQFIPHPSTWLNQRRWEDQQANGVATDEIFGSAH